MCYFHLYAFLVPYITIEHQSNGDKVGLCAFTLTLVMLAIDSLKEARVGSLCYATEILG